MKKISSAFISVFSKKDIYPLIEKLYELNIEIYSTGGTYEYIKNLNCRAIPVEEITEYPSILGGRVKTLHPKVFGGILYRRDFESDCTEKEHYNFPSIDLVIVDLYPFENTLLQTENEAEIIEKIDIGGISLIRAAAKNYKDVVVVPSSEDYNTLMDILIQNKGYTSIEQRKKLASKAFCVSSHYDTKIFEYFNKFSEINCFKKSILECKPLRYGENPHQSGFFYGDIEDYFTQLNGKEISYNNMLDIDSAIALISDFTQPTVAIIKHNNACGIASRNNLIDAWRDALSSDPISAYGGIIISNTEIDEFTAQEINELFFEIIIAPSYKKNAIELLKAKKNRIILQRKDFVLNEMQFRTILNGVIEQKRDNMVETPDILSIVTITAPSKEETDDLIFANKIVKHSKSNAIVLVKNKQMLSSGVGQTSRVDALKQAISKAKQFGFNLKGAVMASDAFFPFADSVEIANKEGISAIIQPGGSIRDKDSIDYCNKNCISMVFTGIRHFKH